MVRGLGGKGRFGGVSILEFSGGEVGGWRL